MSDSQEDLISSMPPEQQEVIWAALAEFASPTTVAKDGDNAVFTQTIGKYQLEFQVTPKGGIVKSSTTYSRFTSKGFPSAKMIRLWLHRWLIKPSRSTKR